MGYQKSVKRWGNCRSKERQIASKRLEICGFLGRKEEKEERSEIGGEELVGMNRTSKKNFCRYFRREIALRRVEMLSLLLFVL